MRLMSSRCWRVPFANLNIRATRVSAVLNPVKLIITNYPEGKWKSWKPSTIPKIRKPAIPSNSAVNCG